jgi:hypothetical protein
MQKIRESAVFSSSGTSVEVRACKILRSDSGGTPEMGYGTKSPPRFGDSPLFALILRDQYRTSLSLFARKEGGVDIEVVIQGQPPNCQLTRTVANHLYLNRHLKLFSPPQFTSDLLFWHGIL